MPSGSSAVCVALLLGAIVVSRLQLEGTAQSCSSVTEPSPGNSYIAIEEECLKGAIKFVAIESMSSIPNNFELASVMFDVYCNTSEGVQLELIMGESLGFGGTTINLGDGAAVCRVVACYTIEETTGDHDRLNYLLGSQPVCDYTVQCPPLDDPPNGQVGLHNTSVFSVANYSCDEDYIIVNTSRECQIDGSWSGSEEVCFPKDLPLEVMLHVDNLFPVVGSIVNLTCSGNGTPPLTIDFYRDNLTEAIDQGDQIVTPTDSAVMKKVLQWEVSETGPSNFTCVIRNSSSDELESSIVQITGVVRRYVQICFEIPLDVDCNSFSNFSEILPCFATELQTNCSCIAPDSFELPTLQSTCNESCPQQLFYSMSVLTESETELNATLHNWLSLHDSVMAAGVELTYNPTCAPLLLATVPSAVCSPSVPTSSQTMSSSTVSSEAPTSEDPPSGTPTASTTDSSDSEGSSDPIVVFIAVFVLVATFVLLTLTLVIMLFFFHKRRKHVSDFAVEGCELPMYDPMQQLDQQGFDQQKQEPPPSVNDKVLQKSTEVTQATNNNLTSNGRIP